MYCLPNRVGMLLKSIRTHLVNLSVFFRFLVAISDRSLYDYRLWAAFLCNGKDSAMTTEQKQLIETLHRQGKGYRSIAAKTGLSENTVKSYCRRTIISEPSTDKEEIPLPSTSGMIMKPCLCCGSPVRQTAGRKEKKYCSEECRVKWWNQHRGVEKRKSSEKLICPSCHQPFAAYIGAHRKYCSRECFFAGRFCHAASVGGGAI